MNGYGRKIAEARISRGMTQTDLAKKVGTTQQQIARYESGENDLKSSVLVKLSAALGVTVSYLLGVDDSPFVVRPTRSESRRLPILGLVAAGDAMEAIEQRGRTQAVTSELLELCADPVMVEVAGNSMNRLFPEGALLVVDRGAEVRNGDVAAVFVNGDDVTVKRVYFDGGAVVLHPESWDADYRDRTIDATDPDAPALHFLGRVVSYVAPLDWRP